MKRLKRKKFITLALLAASLFLVAGIVFIAGNANASVLETDKIEIDGSTTVGPIAKKFAAYYQKKHKGLTVTVSESGSGNGAKSLIQKRCNVAAMSRFMKDKEFKTAVENGIYPVAHVIAVDGIVMIVHPSNAVKELTIEKIRDLYLGKYKNWKELGGPDKEIIAVTRDSSSGTFETFHKLVMGGKDIMSGAEVVNSNVAARERVSTTPGAIAYIGLGYLDRSVKGLNVNGVKPSRDTISSGVYPIARPLFMFTDKYPELGTHLHAFMTLYLTEDGQDMVEEAGYIPVTKY